MFFRSSGGCRTLSHRAAPDTNTQPSLQHSYKIKQASTETPSSQKYNVGGDTNNKNVLAFKKKNKNLLSRINVFVQNFSLLFPS